MSEFSEHVSNFTEEKYDLLALNLKKAVASFPDQHLDSIPLRKGSMQPIPLSFAQERLWFLEQLIPGNAIYNSTRIVRLSGLLDINVLKYSLNEIVQRHEVLHTNFTTIAGSPVQIIATGQFDGLQLVDLSAMPGGGRTGHSSATADS